MYIALSDAVTMYARMYRARFGKRRGAKMAKEQKGRLQAKGDHFGAQVWDHVSAEIVKERPHEHGRFPLL